MITAITIVTSTILKAKKMMGGLYTLSVVNIFSDILYIPAIYFWDLYGIVFAILFQKILLMVISFLIIFNRKVKIIQYINSVSVKKINN
jgi:hypothetical protein